MGKRIEWRSDWADNSTDTVVLLQGERGLPGERGAPGPDVSIPMRRITPKLKKHILPTFKR